MYHFPRLPTFTFARRASWRSFEVIAGLALLGFGAPAVASGDGFANVSFTVSGGPNAWILDFTVVPTNASNMGNKSYISLFEIGVEGGTAFTQPLGYTSTLIGSDTTWQGSNSVAPSLKQSVPGGITGFETLVTSVDAPTDVSWTVTLASGSAQSDFYLNGAYQATVSDSGAAHVGGVAPAVPELGTLPLMLLGLGGVAGSLLRRRRADGSFAAGLGA